MSATTTLSEWVKAQRSGRGLGQSELAAAAGVSQARVVMWESGEAQPTLCEAAKLFRALGTADDDVLKLIAELCE